MQVKFDVDTYWHEYQFSPSLIKQMNNILDGQLKYVNNSAKLASFTFMQALVTKTWDTVEPNDINSGNRNIMPFSFSGGLTGYIF